MVEGFGDDVVELFVMIVGVSILLGMLWSAVVAPAAFVRVDPSFELPPSVERQGQAHLGRLVVN